MKRHTMSEAERRVRTWDRIWQAYVHGLQLGDAALVADARRAMADFDREPGTKPLRLADS